MLQTTAAGADLGGGCRGRHPPPPRRWPAASNTTGILQKKTMCFIGVEVEQETSAPSPKKNRGSAPVRLPEPLDSWTDSFWPTSLVTLMASYFIGSSSHISVASLTGIQDSLGFLTLCRRFRIPGTAWILDSLSVALGFRMVITNGIPDSLICILDARARIYAPHTKNYRI